MLVLKNVIINFPQLIDPRVEFEGGKEKFSTTVMIPKDDKETIKAIEAEIEKTIKENIGTFGGKKSGIKVPLRDGDEKVEDYPEFEGYMFFNCSTTRRPKILDLEKRDLMELHREDELRIEDYVYSGQIVNVSVNTFAYNFQGSRGVGMGLNNIQVVGGGELLYDAAGAEFD